jgi:hypothetical protein
VPEFRTDSRETKFSRLYTLPPGVLGPEKNTLRGGLTERAVSTSVADERELVLLSPPLEKKAGLSDLADLTKPPATTGGFALSDL